MIDRRSRVKWLATFEESGNRVCRNRVLRQELEEDSNNTMADYKSYLAANILSEDKVVCYIFTLCQKPLYCS